MLFSSASSFRVYAPTQHFHSLQNVFLMNDIMFSHKTNSFILTHSPFKHQMNKISLLVVWTLIFINLLTYWYRMTFQMSLWYSIRFLHLQYLILSLNFITSFIYLSIMTIMNKLHVLYMHIIYMPYLIYYESSSFLFIQLTCRSFITN